MPTPSTSASLRTDTASSIMAEFASRTGLTSSAKPRRYLWTDAFAVENDLALAARTGDRRFLDRALVLVDQVHRVLGCHRGDDGREGPLGTPTHPTRGGLRIGKELPERRVDEPFDRALEWDRDGQYFHYATHWMSALMHAARATHRPELLGWARDLAQTQHRAFVYGAPGARAMFWKMSIDLSRPLVRSMGQHDALDGFVTYAMLEREGIGEGTSLAPAIADFASMIDPQTLASDDPLGIGALLVDAADLATLEGQSVVARSPVEPSDLVEAALVGIAAYVASGALGAPVRRRLAFRELGLSIGLHAIERIVRTETTAAPLRRALNALARYRALAETVEAFWLAPAGRRAIAEADRRDIDEVMRWDDDGWSRRARMGRVTGRARRRDPCRAGTRGRTIHGVSTPPDEKRPAILVVDDDVALLRAVVGLLARLDCDIVSSSSSRTALELLHEREFAVGLFDVQMPGMNGIELARRARQLPRARSMPIVFVTSLHDQAELVFAGYESGAVDVLSKPVDAHILISKVNVFLDLHRSKRQLEDEVRAHQLALADLDAFAYSVSHDLRAPLRAVSGFAAILAEDHGAGLPEAARALLDDITSAAGTMDRLIDDLLRLSRVGRARAEREPIDLRALAAPIVDELRRIDPGRDVSVVLPDAQPVRGDGPLLRIALENLLRNAWKFTSKRPGARIELGARREGEEIRHFVRDDGVGFDAASARTLFKPFQRFHPRSEFDGTGIGLAIVERVIRHHGGRVWADSVPGQGATFWFTLE